MIWRRRPNVPRLASKGNAKRLVRALGYHDQVSDTEGRLYDLGAGVRRDAAVALASVADSGDVDIGAALIAALGDASGEVRRAAASALGARRDERATAPLADAVLTWHDRRYEAARRAAADALIDLSGPESAAELVRMVIDRAPDPTLARELVAGMVGHGGPETARSACAIAAAELSADDHAIAARAAEVLSWVGPIAVEPLMAALDDPSAARIAAIQALGHLGELRPTDALSTLLSDDDADVRAAAAAALGQIANPAAAQALIGASNDPDQAVRSAALEAIRRLGPLATAVEPSGADAASPSNVAPAGAGDAWERTRGPSWLRSSSG